MKKKTLIILTTIILVETAFVVGLGIVYHNEKQQPGMEISASEEKTKSDTLAVAKAFDMQEVSAGSNDYEDSFIIFIPGFKTDAIIENLNEYIIDNDMDLGIYDLEYPLSRDSVIGWPDRVNNLISNGIRSIETEKGRSSEEIDALIDKMFGENAEVE